MPGWLSKYSLWRSTASPMARSADLRPQPAARSGLRVGDRSNFPVERIETSRSFGKSPTARLAWKLGNLDADPAMSRKPLQANDLQSYREGSDEIGSLNRLRLLRQAINRAIDAALPLAERPAAAAASETSQVPDGEIDETLRSDRPGTGGISTAPIRQPRSRSRARARC